MKPTATTVTHAVLTAATLLYAVILVIALIASGCNVAIPVTEYDQRPLACEIARAETLNTCVQHAAHPRAGCFKAVAEAYGDCLSTIGQPERGALEACLGACTFLRITCEDQDAAIQGVDYQCAAGQLECQEECHAQQAR